MTFGFNYKIQVSSGELVYRNVAPVNNYVLWDFNFLREEILEVLNIKNKKRKMVKVWIDCYVDCLGCGKYFLVKAMVFPVVMYGCESWTVKKAERWRIDAFELWVLEKTR